MGDVMASGSTTARYPIVITAPATAACSARVYRDDGTTAAVAYSTETGSSTVAQPVQLAPGASQTFYVPEQTLQVSVLVNGVEMAGGYNTMKRVVSNGLINVSPDVPPDGDAAGQGLYDNGTVAGTVTINPANGPRQRVTLGGSSGTIVQVTLNATAALGAEIQLIVYQDATGGKFVDWTNITWAGNAWPAIDTNANAVTLAQALTGDGGATWYGTTPTPSPLPGVDPTTVPGVFLVYEAAFDPTGVGNITTVVNRKTPGTQDSTSVANTPTISTPTSGPGAPSTGLWPQKRRFFDCTGTNQSITTNLSTAIGTAVPFVFITAGKFTSDAAGMAHAHLNDATASSAMGFGFNPGTNNAYVVHPTSDNFADYTLANSGATTHQSPHVVTLIHDGQTSGRTGVTRFDGTVMTLNSAGDGWNGGTTGLPRTYNRLLINANTSGFGVGKPQTACVILANTNLSTTIVKALEQWAGYLAGVTSTALGL